MIGNVHTTEHRLKVYQVELTNHCSAKCSYCPHETHQRPRGYMDEATFYRTLDVMTNRVVSLHHFGEPLLHPGLVGLVRGAASRGFDVGFSTNGRGRLVMDQAQLNALAGAGLKWLRLHTDPFGVRRSHYNVPEGLEFTEHAIESDNGAPRKELVSFSGHLPIKPKHGGAARCSFLRDGWRVVLWNGDLALCCHDVEGTNDQNQLCPPCDGYVFSGPRDWGNYGGPS